MSTSQAIRERIASQPAGEPFTPALFAGLGSRAAIDQALMRLVKAGSVERIGHGLYIVPKAGRFGIKAMPAPEQVARTVAEAEGATIEVHGAEAARRLGLSTQMPAQAVFQANWSSDCSTWRRANWRWRAGLQAKRCQPSGTWGAARSHRTRSSRSRRSCQRASSRR